MYIYIHNWIYMYTYIYLYTYICIYTCNYTSSYPFRACYTPPSATIYIYLFISIHIHILYIRIYIYIYIHTYIYIYVYNLGHAIDPHQRPATHINHILLNKFKSKNFTMENIEASSFHCKSSGIWVHRVLRSKKVFIRPWENVVQTDGRTDGEANNTIPAPRPP
jgi:hypothetical protein